MIFLRWKKSDSEEEIVPVRKYVLKGFIEIKLVQQQRRGAINTVKKQEDVRYDDHSEKERKRRIWSLSEGTARIPFRAQFA